MADDIRHCGRSGVCCLHDCMCVCAGCLPHSNPDRHERNLYRKALQYALSLPEPPTLDACKAWIADHEKRRLEESHGTR